MPTRSAPQRNSLPAPPRRAPSISCEHQRRTSASSRIFQAASCHTLSEKRFSEFFLRHSQVARLTPAAEPRKIDFRNQGAEISRVKFQACRPAGVVLYIANEKRKVIERIHACRNHSRTPASEQSGRRAFHSWRNSAGQPYAERRDGGAESRRLLSASTPPGLPANDRPRRSPAGHRLGDTDGRVAP